MKHSKCNDGGIIFGTLDGTHRLLFKKVSYAALQKFTEKRSLTRFFFYKNTLYKNVHDENGQKIKNIVRILPSWKFSIYF